MTEVTTESSISGDELLARFITSSGWIRRDQTLRQDAFIPPPDLNLSVTRHRGLSPADLWQIGEEVARVRPATLYGSADVTVAEVHRHKLRVDAQPLPENLNHASIIGWPSNKPAQKILAQQLAAVARYTPKPPAAR